MPVSVQIHRGDPTGVMILTGCHRHYPGVVPYIYIDGGRHPLIVDYILSCEWSVYLIDRILEVEHDLISCELPTVLACLKGEDLLCVTRKGTMSDRVPARQSPARSSGYLRWAIMQHRAATIHRRGLSK